MLAIQIVLKRFEWYTFKAVRFKAWAIMIQLWFLEDIKSHC